MHRPVRTAFTCLAAAIVAACDAAPVTDTGQGARVVPGADAALRAALVSALPTQPLEVVVTFDPARTATAAIISGIVATGARVLPFKHLPMVATVVTPEQLAVVGALPGVRSVALNRRLEYYGAAAPVRRSAARPLHESVPTIRANAVHAAGYDGKGIGIAILDTGIDGLYNADLAYPSHTVQNVKVVSNLPDLLSVPDPTGGTLTDATRIFVTNLPNSETSTGHGTHVAGIAAGLGTSSAGWYTGVAPGAHLIGISTGDALFVIWALAGFDYILEHHEEYNIKVVNNSWGSSGTFDPNDPINVATRAVHDAGVTVVFAAGNSGPDANTLNPYSAAPWVISVAAGCKLVTPDPTNSASRCTDPTGQGRAPVLATFSSRGVPGDALYHPDVTAPGVRIVSTRASTGTVLNALDAPADLGPARICAIATGHVAYYTCASGTSMAAPHVAGVVALLQQVAGGRLTPDQVLEALTSTARPLDGYAEFEVGAGYVDAFAAAVSVFRGTTAELRAPRGAGAAVVAPRRGGG